MEEMLVGSYYCCLSVAFTAEQADMYQRAALAGADMSRVEDPFSTKDGNETVGLAKMLGKMGVGSNAKPRGSVYDYAAATGRQVVYYDPSGDTYKTEDGEVVEYNHLTMVRQVRRVH